MTAPIIVQCTQTRKFLVVACNARKLTSFLLLLAMHAKLKLTAAAKTSEPLLTIATQTERALVELSRPFYANAVHVHMQSSR